MSNFTGGTSAFYETLMKRTPIPGHDDLPRCSTCIYYRPHRKYRTCFFTRCIRDRDYRTFRDTAYLPVRGEITGNTEICRRNEPCRKK